MSFFQSVKSAASAAAAATQAAAKSAAESAKKTYAELKAPPSKIRCLGCPLEIDVPPTIWDWTCPNGHVCRRSDEACTQCQAVKPPNLPEPSIICPTCNSVNPVPSSNMSKHVKDAARETKRTSVAVVSAVKSGVEHLRATPTTFHCAHCNTLLAVPTGPWACQTCTCENLEEVKQCKQCGQKKSDQKAICGVCRQSTVIPSSNFVDGLKYSMKDLSQQSKKIYYTAAGKPYVTCNRCGAHVAVAGPTKAQAEANVEMAAEKKEPAQQEGAKSSAPEGVPNSPVAEGASSPSAASSSSGAEGVATEQMAAQYQTNNLVCTNCKNNIE